MREARGAMENREFRVVERRGEERYCAGERLESVWACAYRLMDVWTFVYS